VLLSRGRDSTHARHEAFCITFHILCSIALRHGWMVLCPVWAHPLWLFFLVAYSMRSVQQRGFAAVALDVNTQPQLPALSLGYNFTDPTMLWAPKSFQGMPKRPDASKAFADSHCTCLSDYWCWS
jgi:hypothetical protein